MEPFAEEQFDGNERSEARVPTNQWLVIALIVLLGIAGIAAAYGEHERGQVEQLTVQAATANNAMNQMQAQVNALTARLNEMTAAQGTAATPGSPRPEVSPAPPRDENVEIPPVAAPPATAPVAATPKPAPAKKTTAKHKAPVDKRYAQLKTQLDDQQKQLKETQDQVAKNRAELEGSISSTRDELNGSIARTHEELVALEKKGERSYFEFDLTKAKTFQRVGPMTLSLRKTDTKHKSYDLSMIVDDNELNKKKVNLYEPVWIHPETAGQPLQVVVNRIDKNLVHGYVSAPKYRPSELAALTAPEGTTATQSPTGNSAAQPQQ